MKLGWVIHYVKNVADSLAFYESAFGLHRTMLSEGNEFGMLKTGETTLAFCNEEFARNNNTEFTPIRLSSPPSGYEIGFVTDDVDAAYAKAVAAGAIPVTAPKNTQWNQRVSYVRDLNGFLVEICSPIGE